MIARCRIPDDNRSRIRSQQAITDGKCERVLVRPRGHIVEDTRRNRENRENVPRIGAIFDRECPGITGIHIGARQRDVKYRVETVIFLGCIRVIFRHGLEVVGIRKAGLGSIGIDLAVEFNGFGIGRGEHGILNEEDIAVVLLTIPGGDQDRDRLVRRGHLPQIDRFGGDLQRVVGNRNRAIQRQFTSQHDRITGVNSSIEFHGGRDWQIQLLDQNRVGSAA